MLCEVECIGPRPGIQQVPSGNLESASGESPDLSIQGVATCFISRGLHTDDSIIFILVGITFGLGTPGFLPVQSRSRQVKGEGECLEKDRQEGDRGNYWQSMLRTSRGI